MPAKKGPPAIYTTTDSIEVTHNSALSLFRELVEAFKKYGEENVSFDVTSECDPYSRSDREYPHAYLICTRPMNEEEKTKHLAEIEALKKASEEYKRQQYLALKKEFGDN